ncbi:SMP-30/gluconolactonase/LRE family protein [Noviherbaspirillum saxi]|uniref:SMP-30/Gluconolactonase/LRE-like region domain-containing protein n=1 Tax=Noviherbaspirillum saxi TaxID=2320863 RepID=A0A3A3GAU6_9BURK|nr:SMP-30/gluconolactonase/LRE family protein [Noviherbaspirillum saxi]RJF99315.1 hypothetical protein D3871_12890 [Noviherbaspirillum saxi]
MVQDVHIETVVDGLAFAEAPRWHENMLWFSDFYTHKVMRLRLGGEPETVCEVAGQPSGLGWLPDGRMLVVSMNDRRLLRLDHDGLNTVADLSDLTPHHCNDMVVDRKGRAYIGNFGFDMLNRAPVQSTVLLMVDVDGSIRPVADELLFPNGAVITPDQSTLIIAETFGKRLTAFDIAADGSLGRRRVWANLGEASPDGICLDAEGAVWVASPTTSEFLRVREGGDIADRISVQDQAIACTLGGPEGNTLFMVTGRVSRETRALAERNGRIQAARVQIPGAGSP